MADAKSRGTENIDAIDKLRKIATANDEKNKTPAPTTSDKAQDGSSKGLWNSLKNGTENFLGKLSTPLREKNYQIKHTSLFAATILLGFAIASWFFNYLGIFSIGFGIITFVAYYFGYSEQEFKKAALFFLVVDILTLTGLFTKILYYITFVGGNVNISGYTLTAIIGRISYQVYLIWKYKWFLLGSFAYLSIYSVYSERNMSISFSHKAIYFLNLCFVGYIAIIYFYANLGFPYLTYFGSYTTGAEAFQTLYTQQQATQKVLETGKQQTASTWNATKILAKRIVCSLTGDLKCLAELSTQQQQTVPQGELALGQGISVKLESSPEYQQTTFKPGDTIRYTSHLKVVNSKQTKMPDAEVSCNIYQYNRAKSTQEQDPKGTTLAKPTTIEIPFGLADQDIICSSTSITEPGFYIATTEVTLHGLTSENLLTNLVMNKDSMAKQINTYMNEHGLDFSSVTWNSAQRQTFKEFIDPLYPSGQVLSKSEAGSLVTMDMQTTTNFIIGVDSNNAAIALRSAVKNNGDGNAKITKTEYFANDKPIVACEKTYEGIWMKKSSDTTVKLDKYNLPLCEITLTSYANDIESSNIPIQVLFKSVVTYDYTLKHYFIFEIPKEAELPKEEPKPIASLSQTPESGTAS